MNFDNILKTLKNPKTQKAIKHEIVSGFSDMASRGYNMAEKGTVSLIDYYLQEITDNKMPAHTFENIYNSPNTAPAKQTQKQTAPDPTDDMF